MKPPPMAPAAPPEPLDVDEMLVAYAEEVVALKARVAALEANRDDLREIIRGLEAQAESTKSDEIFRREME